MSIHFPACPILMQAVAVYAPIGITTASPIAVPTVATYAPIGMIIQKIGESYRTPSVRWFVAKAISLVMP